MSYKNRWPLPAALHFVPGGSIPTSEHLYFLNENDVEQQQRLMQTLVELSRVADEDLKAIADHAQPTVTMADDRSSISSSSVFLPSLSVLVEAVFHPLCGCTPNRAKHWADAMVLSYHALDNKNNSVTTVADADHRGSLVRLLKGLSDKAEHALPPRPCGYVFKRGDMAWNCRTCQTDSTCVLCDACFQASDHRGHEVSFHQTSPGGCCDCGDIEAWAPAGCCDKHRPIVNHDENNDVLQDSSSHSNSLSSMLEAVYASQKSREKGEDAARELPPYLRASLALVIGAAVNAIVDAIDGSSIGADLSQWRLRWAEEVCRLRAGCVHDDDALSLLLNSSNPVQNGDGSLIPQLVLNEEETNNLPQAYALHLRLHNDDVHTFEEVIEALHTSRRRRESTIDHLQDDIFVTDKAKAEHMTQLVDSDGQVIVKNFKDFKNALKGFKQLKRQGLHCAVVSSSQLSAEDRARNLLLWLSDIASAHPGASALVCHALVDVTSGDEVFAGVNVWPEPRQIPCWAGVSDSIKRFQAFPVMETSSYLTRESSRKIYELGTELEASQQRANHSFVASTGEYLFFKNVSPKRFI